MKYARIAGTYYRRIVRMALVLPLAIIFWLAVSIVGTAQDVIRIAAIVNDEIISVFDLENRARLVAATTNLPPREDVFKRIEPQVLRTMINERLRLQEAVRLNIRINQREINGMIAGLARRNKMTPAQLWSFLGRRNVDRSALEMQTRARLAWIKVINRRVARQISVGQDEINDELVRLRQLLGKPKLRVAEIFFSVDSPDAEPRIRETAERLIQQVVNGAKFEALAREFSQSTTAGRGGDLGWITDAELDEELAATISVMQPGQISQPVRSLIGYHILYLSDRRLPTSGNDGGLKLEYRQMNLPVPANALPEEIENQRQLAQEVSQTARTCEAFVKTGRRIRASGMERIQTLSSSESGPLVELLLRQEVGVSSEPQKVRNGFVVFMVCNRVEIEAGLPSPEELEERMRKEKVNLRALRYMRDLRRSAYVELRQ
ncbi:MAG: peptidylprolyl isomerase [Alphaproteobacteria bacterium]